MLLGFTWTEAGIQNFSWCNSFIANDLKVKQEIPLFQLLRVVERTTTFIQMRRIYDMSAMIYVTPFNASLLVAGNGLICAGLVRYLLFLQGLCAPVMGNAKVSSRAECFCAVFGLVIRSCSFAFSSTVGDALYGTQSRVLSR